MDSIVISRPSDGPDGCLALMQAARRHGFQGVQLKGHQFADYLSSPQDFAAMIGPHCDLCHAGMVVQTNAERCFADIHAVYPFAQHVAVRHICLGLHVQRDQMSEKTLLNVLRQIVADCSAHGLSVSLHNYSHTPFHTPEAIVSLLEQCDGMGITLDTAHMAKADVFDFAAAVKLLLPFLHNVHLKDMDASGAFVPLGKGLLKLETCVRALQEHNYTGIVCVDEESMSYELDNACAISQSYLQDCGCSIA